MRVVSVVSVQGGSECYAPKIYEATRSVWGHWYWRPVKAPLGTFTRNGREIYRSFRTVREAERVARDLADRDDDLIVDFRVRSGTPVDLTKYGETMIEEGLLARDELDELMSPWS